jgi:hypothetical protein
MTASLSAFAKEIERTYITNDHWYRVPESWWHGVPDIDAPRESDSSHG